MSIWVMWTGVSRRFPWRTASAEEDTTKHVGRPAGVITLQKAVPAAQQV